MMTGLLAARNVLGASHDLWEVNTDMEYQEEIQAPRDGPDENSAARQDFHTAGKGREPASALANNREPSEDR